MSETEVAQELVNISKRVEAKGFVAATDGNISVRLPNGNILATPTSMNKGFVTTGDLVEVTIDGIQIGGTRKP
ncbi:MAG: class II aldolase/adducin family protein, partial [Bacteroidota bacterium]